MGVKSGLLATKPQKWSKNGQKWPKNRFIVCTKIPAIGKVATGTRILSFNILNTFFTFSTTNSRFSPQNQPEFCTHKNQKRPKMPIYCTHKNTKIEFCTHKNTLISCTF